MGCSNCSTIVRPGASRTRSIPKRCVAQLFARATERRLALGPGERFDRGARDRRGREGIAKPPPSCSRRPSSPICEGPTCCPRFEPLSAAQLVDAYERGQAQAVLLRAVRVVVDVRCASPGAARALFRRLKFLGLLHTVVPRDKELRSYHRRPHEPVRVGDQVRSQDGSAPSDARGVRGLEARGRHQMGQGATPAQVPSRKGGGEGGALSPASAKSPPCPMNLAALVRTFGQLRTDWKVSPGRVVLDLPGVGLSVPDSRFPTG